MANASPPRAERSGRNWAVELWLIEIRRTTRHRCTFGESPFGRLTARVVVLAELRGIGGL